MSVRILTGDCRVMLATLSEASVHCCVTSPPYWGLRDYGVEGQLGLEATPEAYVANLVGVFREVRRVLRDDGTVWLNLGDSYASGEVGRVDNGSPTATSEKPRAERRIVQRTGLKPKDVVGIPWRVAFALQAAGWWLRSDVVWSKPNPMPESVTDRPTKAHEYVFLLTKAERYFFDAEAIAEPSVSTPAAGKRNRRSVWTVASEPFPEAHFAVMPTKLVEPCILAGTSARGCCATCGAPWARVVEKARTFESGSGRAGTMPEGKHGAAFQGGGDTLDVRRGPVVHSETVGWQASCDHGGDPVPCTVLDPFGGSGTVARVAEDLGRHSVLCELNPEYVKIAVRRTAQAGLFAQG